LCERYADQIQAAKANKEDGTEYVTWMDKISAIANASVDELQADEVKHIQVALDEIGDLKKERDRIAKEVNALVKQAYETKGEGLAALKSVGLKPAK
jgi:SpoVK/Ycf46/Vps4 family AAA+-type ATPase